MGQKTKEQRVSRANGMYKRCSGWGGCDGSGWIGNLRHARCNGTGMRKV